MAVLADLGSLVRDGVISTAQAEQIGKRSREAMVRLITHLLLAGGVIVAAAGLIALLEEPLPVAIAGALFTGFGILGLGMVAQGNRMVPHALALIGICMLLGGLSIELAERLAPRPGAFAVLMLGLTVVAVAFLVRQLHDERYHLLATLSLIAGLAVHLLGLEALATDAGTAAAWRVLAYVYATALLLWAGWFLDQRLISVLAVVPFAQLLAATTSRYDSFFDLFPIEVTYSLLQMALAFGLCLIVQARGPERMARQAAAVGIASFLLVNICFWIGSIWGDHPGEYLGLQRIGALHYDDTAAREAARQAFRATLIEIPAEVFSGIWAVLLLGVGIWAARGLHRGLFNLAVFFGIAHLYTQVFENFSDEPLSWVIGGLSAIPIAWAIWRLNQMLR